MPGTHRPVIWYKAVVFGGKLKKRRTDLAAALQADLTQPLDWEVWLSAAQSVDELHATCPHPGWLVYCAYHAERPLDTLFDAAIAIATQAAAGDPQTPVEKRTIEELDDLDGPALEQLIIDLEQRHPLAAALVELLPEHSNWGMMHVYDARRALREQQAELEPPDLAPFRTAPTDIARADADALVAAGYVCVVECVYHRWQKQKEALASRAAAAASLLCGSYKAFHDEALAIERETFRFPRRA